CSPAVTCCASSAPRTSVRKKAVSVAVSSMDIGLPCELCAETCGVSTASTRALAMALVRAIAALLPAAEGLCTVRGRREHGAGVGTSMGGRAVAAAVRSEVRARVERLRARGVVPGLATVLVGDDPASRLYVGNKERACDEVGMRSFGRHLPGETT